jgi:hypothetical protein
MRRKCSGKVLISDRGKQAELRSVLRLGSLA